MAIERATETVKVRLVDGKDAEVRLYVFINSKERQRLERILLADMKLKKGMDVTQIEMDAGKASELVSETLAIVWADKNYTADDVEADSIAEVITARLEKFLAGHRLNARAGDSTSNQPQTN